MGAIFNIRWQEDQDRLPSSLMEALKFNDDLKRECRKEGYSLSKERGAFGAMVLFLMKRRMGWKERDPFKHFAFMKKIVGRFAEMEGNEDAGRAELLTIIFSDAFDGVIGDPLRYLMGVHSGHTDFNGIPVMDELTEGKPGQIVNNGGTYLVYDYALPFYDMEGAGYAWRALEPHELLEKGL